MGRFSILLFFLLLPVSCQTTAENQSASTQSTNLESSRDAKIVLINEHPFDLEAMLEDRRGIDLLKTLAFLSYRDTETINTNYDEMKSLVTVVDGPLSPGESIVMEFDRSANRGRDAEYEVINEVPVDINTNPAIIVNAYRIAFPASVEVRAIIDDQAIARKAFRANGPWRERVEGWRLKEGDRRLTSAEIQELLVGKTVRIDVGGTASYSRDGKYQRTRDGETRTGTFEIREDDLICVQLRSDRERCYAIVKDKDGNFTIINDGSIRYRLDTEL